MKVICGWCDRDMGEKLGPDNLISHGICKQCSDKIRQEMKDKKENKK
jgi:hypothetical protein